MSGAIRRFLSREDGMSKLFKTLLLLVVLAAAAVGVYALARGGKGEDGERKLVTVEKGSITEKAAGGRADPAPPEVLDQVEDLGHRQEMHGQRRRQGPRRRPALRDRARSDAAGADRGRPPGGLGESLLRPGRAEFERPQELSKSGVLPKSDIDTKRESFELARVALAKAEQAARADPATAGSVRDRQHGVDHPGAGGRAPS